MYKVEFTLISGLSVGTEYSSVMNRAIVAALWGHDGVTEDDVTYVGNNRYYLITHHYVNYVIVEFTKMDSIPLQEG